MRKNPALWIGRGRRGKHLSRGTVGKGVRGRFARLSHFEGSPLKAQRGDAGRRMRDTPVNQTVFGRIHGEGG